MQPSVNYDRVAAGYDQRYVENRYPGIDRVLIEFANPSHAVLEVGCGTGHWLAKLQSRGCKAVGLDLSAGMLRRALDRVDRALLVRGRAEALPFRARTFERIAVVNALHHFEAPEAFIKQTYRVLRPSGRIVVMGLDPGQGLDEWFIYDYFPRALELDKARYPSTAQIVEWFEKAGFVECSSSAGHHITLNVSARDYLERGILRKDSTSQLSLLLRREYEEGIRRIRRAVQEGEALGQEVRLRANLRLYATYGTVAG